MERRVIEAEHQAVEAREEAKAMRAHVATLCKSPNLLVYQLDPIHGAESQPIG